MKNDLGPAIPAADRALEDGSVEPLVKLLTGAVEDGILDYFKLATAKKKFSVDDVEAGREYVKTYVEFIHYVERIFEATKKAVHGHFPESEEVAPHK